MDLDSLIDWLRIPLRSVGFDIKRYGALYDPRLRRAFMMRQRNISAVIDGGANVGQYGHELRRHGYRGRIISFEPIAEVFQRLQENIRNDRLWACYHLALGEASAEPSISVSASTLTSSLLPISQRLRDVVPGSEYVRTERVRVRDLDSIAAQLQLGGEKLLLKLDVQGSELAALRGAEHAISAVQMLELEVALAPLYDGAPSLQQILEHVGSRRFAIASIAPTTIDPRTGELIEADVIFVPSA